MDMDIDMGMDSCVGGLGRGIVSIQYNTNQPRTSSGLD